MEKISISKMGYVVGIISIIFFLACSVWGWVFASATLRELHFNFLQIAYPWFSFTVGGYIMGLVEAAIYGWTTGALFAWLYNVIGVGKK